MRFILFLVISLALAEPELLVTQQFTDYLKKHATWEVADYDENVFRGWTTEEFKQLLGDSDEAYTGEIEPYTDPDNTNEAGACNHTVRNQGSCGSCWAFATATVVSDRCCEESKDYGHLSPQELVSCDKKNGGCQGGLAATALDYVSKNGLVQEACYPYIARGETCPTKCKDGKVWKAAHVCNFTKKVDCSQEAGMKKCFDAKYGAITVRMVVHQDFTSYKKGIYCFTSGGVLGGHAIRGLGYGIDSKQGFYVICANSWGESWGDKGYFKIEGKEKCSIRMTPGDAWSATGFPK